MKNDPRLPETCGTDCPVSVAASILDGKWTTQIVRELLGGTKRFSELLRGMDGISPKMLTARLRMMENNGLLVKTIYPCVPPKTEYDLTDLGLQMKNVILAMAEFGQRVSDHTEVSIAAS